MSTVTLQLASYQAWSAADRSATVKSLVRHSSFAPAGNVGRMVNDVINALNGGASSVSIDTTNVTVNELCAFERTIQSWCEAAPTPARGDVVRPFVGAMIATNAAFAVERRNQGHHNMWA